jgi:hypothetical protein
VAEWDFAEVTRISTLINRHVRSLAVGQDGSRSVLAGARALVAEGSIVFAPF